MCPGCGLTAPLCSSEYGGDHHDLPSFKDGELTPKQLARLRELEELGIVVVSDADGDHTMGVDF